MPILRLKPKFSTNFPRHRNTTSSRQQLPLAQKRMAFVLIMYKRTVPCLVEGDRQFASFDGGGWWVLRGE